MLNKTLFTNNMVFQINYPIKLVGRYLPQEDVEIIIVIKDDIVFSEKYKTDKEGILNIEIPIFDSELNRFEIHVSTSQTKEVLENCRLGHVFLSMGQSNMGFPLKWIDSKEKVLSRINKDEDISFLSINDAYIKEDVIIRPLVEDNEFKIDRTRFMISQTNQVLDFSAIMVVFALDYYKKTKLPVQIIDVSVGGSSLAGFLSLDEIRDNKLVYDFLVKANAYPIGENHYTIPSGIYNEKIYPLRHLKFEGVFWYQGEHHVGGYEAQTFYYEGLKTLIKSYRDLFNQQNLRWINIHIQNHYYAQDKLGIGISLINEAMNNVSKELDEVYTIPVHDQFPNWKNEFIIEEANPIHPTNKYYIGERLAAAFSKPNHILEVKEVQFKDDCVLVVLNQDIKNKDKHLFGFTVGYKGEVLSYADASFINNNTIKVESKNIVKPEVIAYGFFLYNMRCGIYGKHNIPLKPFKAGLYNKENIYYQPYGFEDLSTNHMEQLLLSTMFNQENESKIIKPGRFIDNDSVKIKVKENDLVVSGVGEFSLAINLNQNNHPSMFRHFKYLDIEIENSKEVELKDLVLFTTNQQYYRVGLMDVVSPSIYRFNLKNIKTLELDDQQGNTCILNRLKELEIIFNVKNKSKFIIKNIRLVHSEVDDV